MNDSNPPPIMIPGQPQTETSHVPVKSDEIYATYLQENRVQNIIAQISPDQQLFEIEQRIKGLRKEVDTGVWKPIGEKEYKVSQKLISNYISYLASLMSQNTSLSNLSAPQINGLMKQIIEFLVDDLDSHAEDYEITSYTERTRIADIILNATFMVLNRALDGREAKRMWNTLTITDSNSGGDADKRAKWWEVWKKQQQ